MQRLTWVSLVLGSLCIACPAELPGDEGGGPGTTSGAATTSTGPGPDSSSSATTTAGDPTTGEVGEASTGGTSTGPEPTTGGDAESSGATETTGAASSVCAADPCGGDVVGKWTYDSFLCADPYSAPTDWCEGGVEYTYVWNEGTLEFTGDGSSIVHRRGVQTFRSVLPKKCVGGPCEAVFQGYTCKDDGVTCDCEQELDGPWADEEAPYTVEGHTLHVGEDEIDFCVGDDGLALIHLDLNEWTYLVRDE